MQKVMYYAHYEADLSIPSNEIDNRPGFQVISTYEINDEGKMSTEPQKFYSKKEWEEYTKDKELIPAFTAGRDIISTTFNFRYTPLPDVKTQIPVRWSNKKYRHGWVPK